MQTPTVAKQFSYSTVNCTHMNGICVFTKFDIWVQQKNILFLLIEIKKSVLLIWTMRIIWHNQYSIFQEKKQTNYAILRENKNSQKTKTNCEIYKSFIKSLQIRQYKRIIAKSAIAFSFQSITIGYRAILFSSSGRQTAIYLILYVRFCGIIFRDLYSKYELRFRNHDKEWQIFPHHASY